MPGTLQGNYESLSEMDRPRPTGSWKKFFVIVTGKTEGAHEDWVRKLKGVGQSEVNSPEESDYLLVFCPITSRAGTNITEALESVQGETSLSGAKPIILVLMHPTFDHHYPVPGTWAYNSNPKVSLTVDCLFYRGELLPCSRNADAWSEVRRFVGVSKSQAIQQNWKKWCVGVAVVLAFSITGLVIYMIYKKYRE